MRNSKWNLQTW